MSGAGEAEGDESAPATEAASEGACDPCRRVFDDLSLKLVSALEAHPAVGAVELYSAPAVTRIQLGEWEARNRGCCLPEDYKAPQCGFSDPPPPPPSGILHTGLRCLPPLAADGRHRIAGYQAPASSAPGNPHLRGSVAAMAQRRQMAEPEATALHSGRVMECLVPHVAEYPHCAAFRHSLASGMPRIVGESPPTQEPEHPAAWGLPPVGAEFAGKLICAVQRSLLVRRCIIIGALRVTPAQTRLGPNFAELEHCWTSSRRFAPRS